MHEFEDLHDAELPEDTSNNEENESFLFHDAHELYPENPNYDVVVKYFPRSYASLDSIVLPQETNDSDNESAITTADNTDYDTDDSPPPTPKINNFMQREKRLPLKERQKISFYQDNNVIKALSFVKGNKDTLRNLAVLRNCGGIQMYGKWLHNKKTFNDHIFPNMENQKNGCGYLSLGFLQQMTAENVDTTILQGKSAPMETICSIVNQNAINLGMYDIHVRPQFTEILGKHENYEAFIKELYRVLPDKSCMLLKDIHTLVDNKKLPGKKYDVGHSFVISKQHESLYLIDVYLCNTEDIILFAAPDTVRKNPKGIKIKDIMYFGYMVMDNNDENDISHINKKRRRN